MSNGLTAEKALIFRIIHRDNVPWLLKHGLHCPRSGTRDPGYVSVGNSELIQKRMDHVVPIPPGGTLGDYVPFYFTPYSPMLYNIRTGWGGIRQRSNNEIVILAATLRDLEQNGTRFVFADRHAYLRTAQFFNTLDHLNKIDWAILQARDFKRDENDPAKIERYQAEALIHRTLPIGAIRGIACYSDAEVAHISAACAEQRLDLKIIKKPEWYFQ